MATLYLNGEIVDEATASVSIHDRGFVFADGIYEVIRVFGGRPFEMKRHMDRLERSAAQMRITLDPSAEEIDRLSLELLEKDGTREAIVYVQVTRGAGPRHHGIPTEPMKPTTLIAIRDVQPPAASILRDGGGAITVPDDRWAHCDVKVIGLTANILARTKAEDVGCFEAIYVRDGSVTDAASCNVFAVIDGVLCTAPKTNYILWGITREVVLEIARENGVPTLEATFSAQALASADEVFVTGTTSGIVPIVTLNGAPVGAGLVGPITRRLMELYEVHTKGEGALAQAIWAH